jgi:hypothetical protein
MWKFVGDFLWATCIDIAKSLGLLALAILLLFTLAFASLKATQGGAPMDHYRVYPEATTPGPHRPNRVGFMYAPHGSFTDEGSVRPEYGATLTSNRGPHLRL